MPEESRIINCVRSSYRTIRAMHQSVRATANRFVNFIDPPVLILLYHRVAELASDPEMIAVSPENFRRHMDFLKRNFPVPRFGDDWSDLKEPAVIVTFDDGYADNVLEALPILEEAQVPATFFVSTGHVGTGREFWWHRLERILLAGRKVPSRFDLKDPRYGQTWATVSPRQRRMLYEVLNRHMQRVDPDRREDWLDQLERWGGKASVGDGLHRSMTPEELQRLAESPWTTIGAHTVTHTALSALNEEEQRKEILSSRDDLEKIVGTEVTVFSYPFGRKRDYNRTSIRLCREAGFTRAASNFPGQVHRWSDPFQLPRHLVRDWDMETFAAKMETFWTT